MQAGFGVEVLAGEAQVVLHCGREHFGFAVGQIRRLPDHGALGVEQFLWCTQMVGDIKIPAGPGLVFQQRHGLTAQVHIFPQHGAVGKTFPDEPAVLIIMIMHGPPASCLAGPAVPGVIGVPGRHLVLHGHGDQPVQGIISEGVSAVGNSVAVGVIDDAPSRS